LQRIRDVTAVVDPQDIAEYEDYAKNHGLNAVHAPFWEDLPYFQPELHVSPDILHGIHRFFRDHILNWVVNVLTKKEVDARLGLIQPIVGFLNFFRGISSLQQWTGKEDRELQRVLLAAVASSSKLDSRAIRCLRAFQDFAYLVQYVSHSDSTVEYAQQALDEFHATKDAFLVNKGRTGKKKKGIDRKNHFNLQKLAAFSAFIRAITRMGSLPQFSTENTERNHKSMAKLPFRHTNRKDYEIQMLRFEDREENVQLMNELIKWDRSEREEQEIQTQLQGHSSTYHTITRRLLSQQKQLDELAIKGNKRLRGRPCARKTGSGMPTGREGGDGTGGKGIQITHAVRPHSRLDIHQATHQYELHDLRHQIDNFVASACPNDSIWRRLTPDKMLDIWQDFRITIPSVQDDDEMSHSQTVQARPPGSEWPSGVRWPAGLCDTVLIHTGDEARSSGIDGQFTSTFGSVAERI
jgi:Plavaka transposase